MSVLCLLLLNLSGNNLHRKILKFNVYIYVMSEKWLNEFIDLPDTEQEEITPVLLDCKDTEKDGATLINLRSTNYSDKGSVTSVKLVSTDKDEILPTKVLSTHLGNDGLTAVKGFPTYSENDEIPPINFNSTQCNNDSITLVKLDSTDDGKYKTHEKLDSSLEENKNKENTRVLPSDYSRDDNQTDLITKTFNDNNIEEYDFFNITATIETPIGKHEDSPIGDDLQSYLGYSPLSDDIPLTWPTVQSPDLYYLTESPLHDDDPLQLLTLIYPKEEIRLEECGGVDTPPQDNISQDKSVKTEVESPTTIDANKEVLLKHPLPQDEDGDTMLHVLIAKNECERCLLCIPQCISGHKGLDTVNNMGQTALHMACYTKDIAVTKSLLENGAEPCLLDADGNLCLHIACEHNHYELVECILKCLHSLKQRRTQDIINVTNTNGLAPVHIATVKENTNIILILHQYGANIDKQDDCCGKTPLIFAVESLQLKVVGMLIDRLHADVNIRNFSDFSPLHYAAQANSEEMVKLLLNHGAEVGTKTVNLKTEKDLATDNNVKVLLERFLRKNRRRKLNEND